MKFDLSSDNMGLKLNFVQPPCVCGIDVRPGSYDIVIADIIDSMIYKRRVIRPVFIGKVADERECLFVMLNYSVGTMMVDARPETTLAQRLQQEAQRHFITAYRAQYNTQPSAVEMTLNEAEGLYTLERTMTMDVVHHYFQTLQQIVLPKNFRDCTNAQFTAEMSSPTRTPQEWHGRDYWQWVKGGPDHAFHAFNMMICAARVSGLIEGEIGGESTIMRGEVVGMSSETMDPDDPRYKTKIWENAIRSDDGMVFDA